MSDTTLRQQAELVELAPEAILVHERGSGVIRFWNRAAEELYGFGRQEALGRVSHELLQSQLPRPRAEIEAAVDRDGRWSGEVVQTTRDGRQIVVASRWAARTDEAGSTTAYVEIDTDITEQRQMAAEQARLLQHAGSAEAQFRGLLESAPDPVVIVDAQGVIRIVNRQTEVVFGYQRAELIGHRVEVLLPERFRSRHLSHRGDYQHNPHTRPMGIGMELFGRRRDGFEFPVEISLSPMTSAGEPLVISTIRDITGRKQAEERLKATAADLARSNAELEQFAYVASHDLQEPLRMVAGYTQLLARRYQGQLDQDADEFIGFAVDGAKRMQDLINDLLTYSRVGTRVLQVETVDMGELVDQVMGDLAQAIEEARATVSRGELPTLRADPTQLRQLFQNLIGNAIKFHGERAPEVHVSAERTDGSWLFNVRDNGIGIEPQYLDRIFVLF
ncbi:MAG TPA: PAS domain S-box protein, partial [Chloroflexota bacterium]|nr:PAS domain S-box protein [Chloroflexota bacterium]